MKKLINTGQTEQTHVAQKKKQKKTQTHFGVHKIEIIFESAPHNNGPTVSMKSSV